MLKHLTFITLLLSNLLTHGNTIEIRYHVPEAKNATMIWGVNDWNISANQPPGTFIENKVMHTPMVKEGEDYVLKINVPDGTSLDYVFQFKRVAGPFKASFNYYDLNQQAGKKSYQSLADGDKTVRISPDLKQLKPFKSISLLRYSLLFFFLFSIPALGLLVVRKFLLKTPFSPLNPTALFLAIPISLFLTLVIIRALITNQAVQFLMAPLDTLPLLFKTAFQDLLYTFILTLLFGIWFLMKKNHQTIILWIFGSLTILSIAICMTNISITALLGRPFNYRWLYYSDFLMSSDASKAILNNLDKQSLLAYLTMILAAIPLLLLVYHALIKTPKITFTALILCFGMGTLAKESSLVEDGKKENPVIYFMSSLWEYKGLPALSIKKDVDISAFTRKNKNDLQDPYASKFKEAGIKNVIVFVLESTAAEYISSETMPFLDSIKSSALFFDAAYAHAPATNKSMVSILCGSYPYLSYKSITAEIPDIQWPSIPSELKKHGYRTSFFNSGDNRFQNADAFLKHRGINEVQDFRQNLCHTPVFSDDRYQGENLEGISDICLPERFFNWLKNDQSSPFFSMMWTYQTHYPYFPTYKRIQAANLSKEKYLNALQDADKALQELVAGLKKRDLFNSTLIVVLGDHGEAFGQHGQTGHAGGIFEENLHIPLIFINPLLFNGAHITEVAGINDVAPSIFSILDKPIPDEWQGESLFSTNRRNKVYFFSPYSDWLFGCREGNYKFIYNATSNTPYLYDLQADPHESVNLADKHSQLVKELHDDLNTWMQYQIQYVNAYLK